MSRDRATAFYMALEQLLTALHDQYTVARQHGHDRLQQFYEPVIRSLNTLATEVAESCCVSDEATTAKVRQYIDAVKVSYESAIAGVVNNITNTDQHFNFCYDSCWGVSNCIVVLKLVARIANKSGLPVYSVASPSTTERSRTIRMIDIPTTKEKAK